MIELALIGIAAGVMSALVGGGGGIVFVPALVMLVGLDLVDAGATSLLAIVPVAIAGTIRQHHYGNVAVREGLLIGLLAVPAAVAGVVLADALPMRVVELAFAALALYVAARFARRLAPPRAAP